MNRLSPGARRLLALALLALPASLGWAAIVSPWLGARDATAARVEQALSLEARALSVAGRGPALTAEAAALRAALADGAEAVPGASHALAGAALQRRLREAAARHGGTAQSMETLPEVRAGDGTVGVRARLQASAEGLRDLLAEIEGGRTPMQVRALALNNAAARGGAQPLLEVQVELRGLRETVSP
jgi:Type II secretion system (T2SS), protein M subtype b